MIPFILFILSRSGSGVRGGLACHVPKGLFFDILKGLVGSSVRSAMFVVPKLQ